jgi:hypothetical protein
MSWQVEVGEIGAPRVLLVSQRALRAFPSRALRFEFEDHVRALDAVDLLAPNRPVVSSPLVRRATRAVERVVSGVAASFAAGTPQLAPKYDVLFIAVESLYDLQLLHPFSWLLRRARTSICFIDEVWRKGLRDRAGEIRLLRGFDRILVGTAGSAASVEELAGRPCAYLAPSVDAAALCPYPDAPPRAIDVYSMGRRSPETHAALHALAERRKWFYLYDTLTASRMPDFREHRRFLGNLLQRTRYFLAYPGKVDALAETGGQQEIGFRYFEGAAAGTLLVGEAPANPWFEKLFGWPDAIIPLPFGATDVAPALAAFEADPSREERARRTNVREALLRHDHAYRWSEVLRLVGLPETQALELRRRTLRDLADAISRPGATIPGEQSRIG